MHSLFRRHAKPASAALMTAARAACFTGSPTASPHAVVGDRVFPATLRVDDPGVGDEIDTQFGHIKTPNDSGDNMNVNTVSYEWDKLTTRNLVFSVASNYVRQNAPNGGSAKGWDNVTVGAKYLIYANARHEFMTSIGLKAEIGGTGAKSVGNSFSTFTPDFYFGKGFGDLPASLSCLRPFAITGELGPTLTMASSDNGPDSFGWGLTLQYSIPYPQSQVKNFGIPQPFNNVVLVVEDPMSTCTAGACAGHTTGTINPGLLWLNRYGQFCIEADPRQSRERQPRGCAARRTPVLRRHFPPLSRKAPLQLNEIPSPELDHRAWPRRPADVDRRAIRACSCVSDPPGTGRRRRSECFAKGRGDRFR
ncbi:hypothetical protein PQR70_17550 [Paraburkholderia madseniana]|uniref:Transporter n=1 Tax=Paraburkholderia madseniana TaxID=2599607 RepID=A0AAP5BDH0_9BURK|nr:MULTISPECIES: hypothetical protein [Paraburkholderia]MCX4146278.1 hypothetical protein [Paraburkholderia madseniana]MDN7149224.1 hypothetical protein [Paraburkholderia sp. WS6]MDQ6408104.1 hypothetical protein [Paraburkholderia madseniana]